MFYCIMSIVKKPNLRSMSTICFIMYYPCRDEKELLSGNPYIYASKLSEPGVINLVNQNYSLVESFATIVDNAFLRLSSDTDNIMDP